MEPGFPPAQYSQPFEPTYGSPIAVSISPNGMTAYVACATAAHVAAVDLGMEQIVTRLRVPPNPSGLATSVDGSRLYVTCANSPSRVCEIDTTHGTVTREWRTGHTTMAPALSPDGQTLYVCNRFDNDVAIIRLSTDDAPVRIPVEREPVATALTPSGKHLLVVNHLHRGPANQVEAAIGVSVIDTSRRQLIHTIRLPMGSSLGRGIAVSPDGRFAAVTHLRSMFWLPTTSVDLGRINANALTFLDLNRWSVLGTVLLDQTCRGAANPWAVAWTPDGRHLMVSHAGTHELSVVQLPGEGEHWNFASLELSRYAQMDEPLPSTPIRPLRVTRRIALPGEGPRGLAICGSTVYVANYFSDHLCRVDLTDPNAEIDIIPIWSSSAVTQERMGEMLFNDGRLCAQGWQSCASCHDADARTDALNWDLMNDGVGNPKNTKSLVSAHQTAPAMALGIRSNAQVAVRAGVHHILFTHQPDAVPAAIDAYLTSLHPMPSPHLVDGQLSAAAARGKGLFFSTRVGCSGCHAPPLWTDLTDYDVGTSAPYRAIWGVSSSESSAAKFDTPTLFELWRTSPYLHDGSATTLREVLIRRNADDKHGQTSHLKAEEVDDLIEFLLSL